PSASGTLGAFARCEVEQCDVTTSEERRPPDSVDQHIGHGLNCVPLAVHLWTTMSTRAGRLPRRLPGASLVLIGCLVAVVALAAGYQAIATARERARFPPPGKLVDIGGYQLHLRCAGNGSPAVILESGFGMSSNAWALIQPEVAKFTRACSYDRTGYGWSDPGPSTDPVPVLHTLLRNADISGPFVMVGHSYGSGLVRRYVYRFPDEVGGMVLASTSYPDQEVRRIAADENRG